MAKKTANKPTEAELLDRLNALTKQVESLTNVVAQAQTTKSEKPKASQTTQEWKTVQENTVKKDGVPVAYSKVIQKGNKKQLLLSVYSRPIQNPRGDVADLPEGTVKAKRNGKTVYYIPKKAIKVESKADLNALLKGF